MKNKYPKANKQDYTRVWEYSHGDHVFSLLHEEKDYTFNYPAKNSGAV